MQKWNSQFKSKNTSQSNVSKMMSQIDQNKIQTKKDNHIELPEDYFEKLAQPRSKKYIRLVQEQMAISSQMEEIEKKIQELNVVLEPSDVSVSEEESKSWWETETSTTEAQSETSGAWWETETSTTEAQSEISKAWWEKENSLSRESAAVQEMEQAELQQQKEELARKYKELQEQLAESKRQLEQELPVAGGLLGLIYLSSKEQKLLDYGVIAIPGKPYATPEELLEQVKPQTEREKQQWLKGNQQVILEILAGNDFLDVEIYMDAICVIREDGSSRVVRD